MNATARWTPRNLQSAFENTMRSMFDDYYRRGEPGDEDVVQSAWTPAVDVKETDGGIAVYVELPGIAKKDVDVSLDNHVLTVSGERRFEGEKERYHRIERPYGKFTRSFRLPRDIDGGKVKASFADGILTLELPRAEEALPRQIKIS